MAYSQPPVLTLHHLNKSRSQRILWLLEELNVPYEIKKYERVEGLYAPKELYNVHPLGRSPIITDGDVTLAESGAIIQYIIEQYGKPVQLSAAGRVDNLYFTNYTEGSFQPILFRHLLFNLVPTKVPFLIRPLINFVFKKLDKDLNEPEFQRHGKLIERHLAKTGGWFAGGSEPTSADYLMIYALENFLEVAPQYAGPKTKEFVERVHKRPAYKKAVEKGGDYASAKH